MSEECTHNCETCGSDCSSRDPKSMIEKPHELSSIKKVIAVVSGKGGVGKSLVTSMMAAKMQNKGFHTAILDADITGPSIPKAFGLTDRPTGDGSGALLPVKSKSGVDIMSLNLLLNDETAPVVWRGPIIAGTVTQFWKEVIWKDVDYMFVDMPPGTGDVPLTVFQSLPVDGIIIVTSPQDLVSMIVEKAVKMARLMNIPIIGIVENMSYFECPDCHSIHYIYGKSQLEEIAGRNGIKYIARIPIEKNIAACCDNGMVEALDTKWLDEIADHI